MDAVENTTNQHCVLLPRKNDGKTVLKKSTKKKNTGENTGNNYGKKVREKVREKKYWKKKVRGTVTSLPFT